MQPMTRCWWSRWEKDIESPDQFGFIATFNRAETQPRAGKSLNNTVPHFTRIRNYERK